MSRRVGQVRRRDANEKPIRAALAAVGATTTQVSGKGAPDLLIAFRGRLYAVEVKGPKGKRTEAQEASQWPIVRSIEDALETIGVVSGSSRASTPAEKSGRP
jgi:hypothetical protein